MFERHHTMSEQKFHYIHYFRCQFILQSIVNGAQWKEIYTYTQHFQNYQGQNSMSRHLNHCFFPIHSFSILPSVSLIRPWIQSLPLCMPCCYTGHVQIQMANMAITFKTIDHLLHHSAKGPPLWSNNPFSSTIFCYFSHLPMTHWPIALFLSAHSSVTYLLPLILLPPLICSLMMKIPSCRAANPTTNMVKDVGLVPMLIFPMFPSQWACATVKAPPDIGNNAVTSESSPPLFSIC